MSKTILELYITGQSARSEAAVANLQHICREYVAEPYEIVSVKFHQESEQPATPQIAEPALA